MPFEIPRAVLALPVWLIDRLRIDDRASRARPLVVRIDIVHMHEETRVRDVRGQRGIERVRRKRRPFGRRNYGIQYPTTTW